MKLTKTVGKISVIAVAAVAAVTMWSGGTAHADTYTWGAIEPVSADTYQSWTGSGPECLALNGSDGYYNDHTRVIQWQCSGNDDQQWETRAVGTDGIGSGIGRIVYQIVNKKSGKCMEVRDYGGNGSLIDQVTCANLASLGLPYGVAPDSYPLQMWEMPIPASTQEQEIVPLESIIRGSEMCLDVDSGLPFNGTKVQQWTCHGGDNQHFVGTPLDGVYSVRLF